MLYFTSDLHFGSDNTIKFDNRPFKHSKQFINKTIKTWNKTITKEDTLYVIGDFIDYHEDTKDRWKESLNLIKKVRTNVILIIGNNEKRVIKLYFDDNFEKFKEYCISIGFKNVFESANITIGNIPFHVVHKPKDRKEDTLNLFGHSHRAMGLYKPYGFNIGCDLNNYQPFSESDIKKLLYKKEVYWDNDENLK